MGKEGDEFFTGMTDRRFPDDFTGLGIECGVERESAPPVVFKSVTFGAAWGHWQHRIKPIQRLNLRLLIDAENRSMLRRIHIEADDVSSFRLKFWVVRRHISFDPVRLQTGSVPNANNHRVVYSKMGRQFAATPMCRAIRRWFSCPRQNSRFHFRCALLNLSTLMTTVEASQALFLKPLLPSRDEAAVATQGLLNKGERFSFAQHQDQSSPTNVVGAKRSRSKTTTQFLFNFRRQLHGLNHHAPTLRHHRAKTGPTFTVPVH